MKTLSLLALCGAAMLSGCGRETQVESQDSSLQAVSSAFAATGASFRAVKQLFNFAQYAAQNPQLAILKPYVPEGAPYLAFGEKSKFRVESNFVIDANTGLNATGSRYVRSQFYLDGWIFDRELSSGHLVDLSARADFATKKLTGYIRFLGDDKYSGEIKLGIDKVFMRDLTYDKTIYGLPMLGVQVSGTLGGELGLEAGPGLRADDALSYSFEPKLKLNGEASGNIKALLFLEAQAKGTIQILDLALSTTAALGALPSESFVYGSAALDGGKVTALDGRIDLYAAADIGGILPNGVNPILWNLLGIPQDNMEWHHTLWDPEPAYQATIQRYGTSFGSFLDGGASAVSCAAKVPAVRQEMLKRRAALEAEKSRDDIVSLVIASNIAGVDEVLKGLDTICQDGGEFSLGTPFVATAGSVGGASQPAVVSAPSESTTDDGLSWWKNPVLDPW